MFIIIVFDIYVNENQNIDNANTYYKRLQFKYNKNR